MSATDDAVLEPTPDDDGFCDAIAGAVMRIVARFGDLASGGGVVRCEGFTVDPTFPDLPVGIWRAFEVGFDVGVESKVPSAALSLGVRVVDFAHGRLLSETLGGGAPTPVGGWSCHLLEARLRSASPASPRAGSEPTSIRWRLVAKIAATRLDPATAYKQIRLRLVDGQEVSGGASDRRAEEQPEVYALDRWDRRPDGK